MKDTVRYDYTELKARIKEVYGKQSAFAAKLGISERTLSMKLNNKSPWYADEIGAALEALNLGKCWDYVDRLFLVREDQAAPDQATRAGEA